jgi:hypothetical protein
MAAATGKASRYDCRITRKAGVSSTSARKSNTGGGPELGATSISIHPVYVTNR